VTVPLGPGWVTLHVSVLWTSVRLALVSINESVLTDLRLPKLRGYIWAASEIDNRSPAG
jgi:hypothetical protein